MRFRRMRLFVGTIYAPTDRLRVCALVALIIFKEAPQEAKAKNRLELVVFEMITPMKTAIDPVDRVKI